MRDVSDQFLLNVAEETSALVGLFLVGVFFFVETGFRRWQGDNELIEPYFRSGTRIVLILFAIPLLVSMTLVAMEPVWSRVVFFVLSLMLVAANVDTVRRIRRLPNEPGKGTLLWNEAFGTLAVVLLVTLPWILGGIDPGREDLTWSILLSFASGFLSVSALVLSAYDLARVK